MSRQKETYQIPLSQPLSEDKSRAVKTNLQYIGENFFNSKDIEIIETRDDRFIFLITNECNNLILKALRHGINKFGNFCEILEDKESNNLKLNILPDFIIDLTKDHKNIIKSYFEQYCYGIGIPIIKKNLSTSHFSTICPEDKEKKSFVSKFAPIVQGDTYVEKISKSYTSSSSCIIC